MRIISTCLIATTAFLLSACDGSFKINGETSGLTEGELVINITGTTSFGDDTESITLTDNSAFVTTKDFVENTEYSVEITSQPEELTCSTTTSDSLITAESLITVICDAPNEVVEVEEITLTGEVYNLKGTIQLQNTENNEIITVESDATTFTFEDEVSNSDGYNITIYQNEDNLDCAIQNGVADLTNAEPVILRCELPFISLNPIPATNTLNITLEPGDLGYEEEVNAEILDFLNELAYLEFVGRATDIPNETPDEVTLSDISSYNGLSAGNFQLSENGIDISESESFPEYTPLNYGDDFTYHLVILIDTSTSISDQALEKSKQAALDLIQDSDGETLIHDNQLVSIVTFDYYVYPETIVPSNDLATLTAQINAIEPSANSSSMNCPIIQSFALWDDYAFITERNVIERTHSAKAFNGSLVIISDGVDTSSINNSDCHLIEYNEDSGLYQFLQPEIVEESEEGEVAEVDEDLFTVTAIDNDEEQYIVWEGLDLDFFTQIPNPYTAEERFDRLKDYQNVYVITNGEEYAGNDFFETITEPRNIFTTETANEIVKRISSDTKELDDNEFGLFYYSYISPNRSGSKIKSQIDLIYNQDSTTSALYYEGIDTSFFVNYLPDSGFVKIFNQ